MTFTKLCLVNMVRGRKDNEGYRFVRQDAKRGLPDSGAPKRTRKLRSYGAARRQVMPESEHWSHNGLNNRANNFHVPVRMDDAGLPLTGNPSALRLDLFRPAQPFRSVSLKTLGLCYPSCPSEHGRDCVLLTAAHTASPRSYADNVTAPRVLVALSHDGASGVSLANLPHAASDGASPNPNLHQI
ncbi:hypothetical protein [Mesorhizobium sp. YC-39]|uniref:hypothetical protein n=1 Tax=unclassified Mesorhizobium TaxID=325217 RepID=UPI0039951A96